MAAPTRTLGALVIEGERLGMSTGDALRRAARIMGSPEQRVMPKPAPPASRASTMTVGAPFRQGAVVAAASVARSRFQFAMTLAEAERTIARVAARVRDRAAGMTLARRFGYID